MAEGKKPIRLPEAESDERAAPDARDGERARARAQEAGGLIVLLLSGRYIFDAARGAYLDRQGRPVPWPAITAELERVRKFYGVRVAELSAQLGKDGRGVVRVGSWARAVADELKPLHLTAEAAARGGFDLLTVADRRELGRRTRFQYQRLEVLAAEIVQGQQAPGPGLLRRSLLYVNASRRTFAEAQREVMREAGMRYEMNEINSDESCAECEAEADKGWVEVGTLSLPGTRVCVSSCRCEIVYAEAA